MNRRTITALRPKRTKNVFARGVAVLVGGTAGAQFILLLAAPLLTRIYSPEDFGLVATYTSLLTLISVVSSLRYEQAIPLPESDDEAANITILSLLLLTLITVLSSILITLFPVYITSILGIPALVGCLWLLPVGLLLGGCYSIFNYWSVRKKNFSLISKTRIFQSLATLSIQLAAYPLGALALLLGSVAGQGIGTTSLMRPALALTVFRQVSWGGFRVTAKRYKQFPLYSVPSSFLNTAGRQLPAILVAAYLGPISAGIYSLALRIILAPFQIINQATAQVFVTHAVDASRQKWLDRLVIDICGQALRIYTLPLTFIALISPHVFGLIFGHEWSEAGVLVAVLSPWVLISSLESPISTVPGILNRQGTYLSFEIAIAIVRLSAFTYGLMQGSLFLSVALFVGGAVILMYVRVVWLATVTKAGGLKVTGLLATEIIYGLIAYSIGWVLFKSADIVIVISYLLVLLIIAAVRSLSAFFRGVNVGEEASCVIT